MLRVGQNVYRLANALPPWKEVWDLFLSEPETYEYALEDAERAADWIREHQNMTPEESVENEFEVKYEEMIEWFPNLHKQPCYRAIGYDRKCTPEEAARLDPLGIYWSEYDEGAETYWNPNASCVFVYRARIDFQHINLLETLTVKLHNPEEYEIRFNEGSPIYIYDCTVAYDGRWGDKEEAVKIEDYRTC